MALYLGSTGITKAYLGATEITKAYLCATEVFSASGFSAEAQQYFDRLDAAGDTTYTPYKTAIATYIYGLVSNSIWDTLESSCLFVGVGFQGCFVPLKSTMPAVTNNNFVSGDQSLTDGLTGDGSTKYISTGTLENDYSLSDTSLSVYLTANRSNVSKFYLGGPVSNFALIGNATGFRARFFSSTITTHGSSTLNTALIGITRDNSSDYDWRYETSGTSAVASVSAGTSDVSVFAASGALPVSSTLATYTTGSYIDLATLETLQAQLIADIAAV